MSVPLVLTALANSAEGKVWGGGQKAIELEFEENLEISKLKAEGDRRDRGGGGARTYRAWLKSLGLVFMDDQDRLQLTSAGEALVNGEPPLPILSKQVFAYQFPSAFTHKGSSAVGPRFHVRPYVLLLQLLLDERLGGYLTERDDVAKVALCYGENNSQECVDDIVGRILELRSLGISSLDEDYVEKFQSTRSKERNLQVLFANLGDIANTMSHWLGYTQMITAGKDPMIGQRVWHLAEGAGLDASEVISDALRTPLISDWDDEPKFQRRYGLKPGQRKDTRRLGESRTVTEESIAEREVNIAFMGLASTRVINAIDWEVAEEISHITGVDPQTVERILARRFPAGSVDLFMHEYAQLAFNSRSQATEFEEATASIFRDVFGFEVKHIGAKGLVPDVVISSAEEGFGALLDSKAYKDAYSAGVMQRNRMRDYIEDFAEYSLGETEPAFYAYVVSEYKSTIDTQLQLIEAENGVPGAAIRARDLIRMVKRHKERPYSHEEIRQILSVNRGVQVADLNL